MPMLLIAIIATAENKVPLVIYTSEIFSVFLLLTPCHPLDVLPILFTEASRIFIIKKTLPPHHHTHISSSENAVFISVA